MHVEASELQRAQEIFISRLKGPLEEALKATIQGATSPDSSHEVKILHQRLESEKRVLLKMVHALENISRSKSSADDAEALNEAVKTAKEALHHFRSHGELPEPQINPGEI